MSPPIYYPNTTNTTNFTITTGITTTSGALWDEWVQAQILLQQAEVIPAHSQTHPVCQCGCDCEADGEWHFNEKFCACSYLGCSCVIDAPGKPVAARKAPQDHKRKSKKRA